MSTRSGPASSGEPELELLLATLAAERALLADGRWNEALESSLLRLGSPEFEALEARAGELPEKARLALLAELDACRDAAERLRSEARVELETLARERARLQALASHERSAGPGASVYLDRRA